jgi:cell division septation protein DedD
MHTPDDGFHEIQLNGKQLVFLFMAATVVSVVIFLCGVLVGRGVRAEQGSAVQSARLAEPPTADVRPPAETTPIVNAESDPTVAQAPAAVDDLSYFDRLEKQQPPKEELRPQTPAPAARVVEPPAAVVKPAPAPAPAKSAPMPKPATVAAPRSPEAAPAASGYAVQLAALNSRGEADALAKRLSSKGYAAYVLSSTGGTPAVHRVRVGTFDSRSEAQTVADRLQKEEQFKPWITR